MMDATAQRMFQLTVMLFATGLCLCACTPATDPRENHDELSRIEITNETRPANPDVGSTFNDCSGCPEMVVLLGGDFSMGSPTTEFGRSFTEGPVRRVTIHPIAMSKDDITFEEFGLCVREGGCQPLNSNAPEAMPGNFAVVGVSLTDARAFAAWISNKTGKRYRVPSEAEWEFAARAGTTTAYWTGDSIAESQAAFGLDGPVAVGQYPPNAFGLNDMAGNVWQWTDDCWHMNFVNAPSDGRAWQTGDCDTFVQRGGAWDAFWRAGSRRIGPHNSYSYDHRADGHDSRTLLRSASRNRSTDIRGRRTVGFRVVRDDV